jgi:hypothetical protein
MKVKITKEEIAAHALFFVLLVPCLCMFNQSGNMWANMFGISYTLNLLLFLNKTKSGKKLLKSIRNTIEDD